MSDPSGTDARLDRIEALTAKVKLMDDLDAINGEKIEALEAKLEHAKKGLRKILRTSDRNSAWDIAIDTLEKLKGEKHD